jgi:hypothetical protein
MDAFYCKHFIGDGGIRGIVGMSMPKRSVHGHVEDYVHRYPQFGITLGVDESRQSCFAPPKCRKK